MCVTCSKKNGIKSSGNDDLRNIILKKNRLAKLASSASDISYVYAGGENWLKVDTRIC